MLLRIFAFGLLLAPLVACTARSNGSPPAPNDADPPADTSALDTGTVMDVPPPDLGAIDAAPPPDAGTVDVAPSPDVTATPDTAPSDCRMAACPAGNYCDLGTGRCLPGCAFDEQCPQPGRCNVSSHTCDCGAGRHACGSACVMNDSTATCGTRCEPCPTAPNATTACTGGACQLTCNAGHHRCGDACASAAGGAPPDSSRPPRHPIQARPPQRAARNIDRIAPLPKPTACQLVPSFSCPFPACPHVGAVWTPVPDGALSPQPPPTSTHLSAEADRPRESAKCRGLPLASRRNSVDPGSSGRGTARG